jgi:two-component system, chemotaxis family, protein-glutamate methylesterase/glutaminase
MERTFEHLRCGCMSKVVVIAAPSGGVQTIKMLVSNLPVPCSASVLIVPHMEDMTRRVPYVLREITSMPVQVPIDGTPIEPGYIYVAPIDRHMLLEPGRIRLIGWPAVRFSWSATDPLFVSAAKIYRQYAVGIVLTGGDGYGAAGLRAIRLAGGLAIVQDPHDAVVHKVPTTIAAAHPYPCLSLSEIAAKLSTWCSIPIMEG